MKKSGYTQKSLAVKSGLNETAVRDILKGRSKDPQLSTLRALARTLRCTVEDLYRGPGRPPAYGVADGQQPFVNGNESPEDADIFGPEIELPDNIYVAEIDISAGSTPHAIMDGRARTALHHWQLPPDALHTAYKGIHSRLCMVVVMGDSMSPEFDSGDRVLVNTEDQLATPGGVFLLWDGTGFLLRRCELVPGAKPAALRCVPSNPNYAVHEFASKDVTVMGRVMARWQKI